MQVKVHSKANIEMSIRAFRKKSQKESIVREAKLRKRFEKPSIKKKRKAEESMVKTIRSRKKGFTHFY